MNVEECGMWKVEKWEMFKNGILKINVRSSQRSDQDEKRASTIFFFLLEKKC